MNLFKKKMSPQKMIYDILRIVKRRPMMKNAFKIKIYMLYWIQLNVPKRNPR